MTVTSKPNSLNSRYIKQSCTNFKKIVYTNNAHEAYSLQKVFIKPVWEADQPLFLKFSFLCLEWSRVSYIDLNPSSMFEDLNT